VSKRTANLIVISSHAQLSPLCIVRLNLACVNRKISEMVTKSSNAHVHAIFAEAAFLAGKAIDAGGLGRPPRCGYRGCGYDCPPGFGGSTQRLYKFRAMFATRCLWAGVDLRTVQ
jgi:hypothetical protein